MRLKSMDPDTLWTDYILTNAHSGKSYRLALRGRERGESYCSCPDFRKNTLGTCKHIIYALGRVKQRFDKKIRQTPYKAEEICVFLKYGQTLELRLQHPEDIDAIAAKLVRPFKDNPIAEQLYQQRVKAQTKAIRKNPQRHKLRKILLETELRPYQLDGIAFAVGAGRAILADDMGLGKTIQGIGVAELLSRDTNISKVLIICPASLKAQWRMEIERFAGRSCQLILGNAKERALHILGQADGNGLKGWF